MDTLDGSGRSLSRARDLSDDYFALGVITNRDGHASLRGSLAEANTNAVYDAARRMSQCIRIINRVQFVGIDFDGTDTHLWFLPTVTLGGNSIDLFAGIRDAIEHTAPALGVTNEWVMHIALKPYHTSVSSIWKLDAFSDIFARCYRGHFYSPEIAGDPSLLWHVAYGQAAQGAVPGVMVPESVDALTYARLTVPWQGNHTRVNQIVCGTPECEEARRGFYKSCQIYRAPYVIYDAEAVTIGGTQYVKLTITGRLQNTYGETAGAPATFTSDVSLWDGPTIAAEPYRTDENGLRLWLKHVATGYNPPATVGDNAFNSGVQTLTDNPFASVVPSFFLTQLVPSPAAGAPLWHDAWSQAEMNLRAMCEGCVDLVSTALRNGCEISDPETPQEACTYDAHGLYDYTFEECCRQAFNGRWLPTIATAATSETDAEDTRPDAPMGFGPLPTVQVTAEQFNAYATLVDLLRIYRIDLPLLLQSRQGDAASASNFTPGWGSAGGDACCHTGTATPPTPDLTGVEWDDLGNTLYAAQSAMLANDTYIEDYTTLSITSDYGWYLARTDSEWRVKPDQDIALAIPAAWRYQAHASLQIYGSLETIITYPVSSGTGDFWCGDPNCDNIEGWNAIFGSQGAPILHSTLPCGGLANVATRSCTCTLGSGMRIIAPTLPSCLNYFWSRGGGRYCTGGGVTTAQFTPFAEGYLAMTVPFTDELPA